MQPLKEVQERYEEALDTLVTKVQRDPNILAAILFGSLAYDQVWEKSDIDLWLVLKEGKGKHTGHMLTEQGVNIHAELIPRGEFKRTLEGSLQASFMHSSFARSRLLFSHDESIREWYRDAGLHHIGERDQQAQLLGIAARLLTPLRQAEKDLRVHGDVVYSFLNLLYVVQDLARIEVLLSGEIPGREVIQPALRHNPDFFGTVYADFINTPKDAATVQRTLDAVNEYLTGHTFRFFRPILDWLGREDGARTATEIRAHFERKTPVEDLDAALEWLMEQGHLQKMSAPLRLTRRSQVTVEEAAYYRDEALESSSPTPPEDLDGAYREALDSFIERVKGDRYILGALLFGDLATDTVWDRARIDLTLITQENVRTERRYNLVERGIPIRATLYPRSRYRELIEGRLLGSSFHSSLLESQLVFTKDDTLKGWYRDLEHIGERDRETQWMNAASAVMPALAKAEKWFHIKRDWNYSFLYLMYVVDGLARIETLMTGEVPRRRVIRQALRHDPEFFDAVFTELIDAPKDADLIGEALDRIHAYLDDRAPVLFKPILDFLSDAGGIRTATDLSEQFEKRNQDAWIGAACEWLAEREILEPLSAPRKLTKQNPVEVEEAAYYYEHEDFL